MFLGGVKRFVIDVTPKGSYKFEIVPMPMKRRRIECPACGKTVSVSTKGHVHCHHLEDGAWCNMSGAYWPNADLRHSAGSAASQPKEPTNEK